MGRKLFGELLFLRLGDCFLDFGLERCSFHFPWFSTIFLSLPCFPLAVSYLLMDFPGSPICHLSSFIFISCSCCSLVFRRPNLAVAVVAAIASVALLVLVAVVIVVLVDLRHDGFKNCWLCCRYLEKHRSRKAKTSKSQKKERKQTPKA